MVDNTGVFWVLYEQGVGVMELQKKDFFEHLCEDSRGTEQRAVMASVHPVIEPSSIPIP